MKKVRDTFEKATGISIPSVLIPAEPLFPIDKKNAEEAFLFGSQIAVSDPLLVQTDINQFIESGPVGYYLIGFWGHGVNSSAFYYSRVDSWSKIFFRLPCGGAYMDNEEAGNHLRLFLTSYVAFEEKIRGKVKSLVAIDSMHDGRYKIIKLDGKTVEIKESLYGRPHLADWHSILLDQSFK